MVGMPDGWMYNGKKNAPPDVYTFLRELLYELCIENAIFFWT
jgi:hypothetical protein